MALPEIRLLQAAIAVANELNFSRAADRLHIGQSTLSKQVMSWKTSSASGSSIAITRQSQSPMRGVPLSKRRAKQSCIPSAQ